MIAAAIVAIASIAHGQSPAAPSARAADAAVAEFFSWYVRMWPGDTGPHLRAIRERRAQFAPSLVTALMADYAATAQGGEEIDGLDADPFLNAREPCKRYRPVRTTKHGKEFFVALLGEGGCRAHTSPDVTVQVAWREGRPVFVNFLYSHERGDDLLSQLRRLAASRRDEARSR